MLTFILFRSINLEHAYHFYNKLCSFSIFSIPVISENLSCLITLFFIVVMFIAEWVQRDKDHALQIEHSKKNQVLDMAVYYAIIFSIILFGSTAENQFIYFKF